jgi:hemoglobin
MLGRLGLLLLSGLTTLAAGCAGPTLYERLGKREGITAVIDDFAGRFFADPTLSNARVSRRFAVIDIGVFREHIINQVCAAAGGPEKYAGRNMKDAHAGLRISNRDYDRFVELWKITLTARKVPDPEAREVLGLLEAQRKDIVDESPPDPKSLYARLGGRKAVEKVVDESLALLVKDMESANPQVVNPRVKARLAAIHVPAVRDHLVALICEKAGGPETYIGRDMTSSHVGLQITDKEFDGFLAAVGKVLDDNKVGGKEKEELAAMMSGQRKAIVGK